MSTQAGSWKWQSNKFKFLTVFFLYIFPCTYQPVLAFEMNMQFRIIYLNVHIAWDDDSKAVEWDLTHLLIVVGEANGSLAILGLPKGLIIWKASHILSERTSQPITEMLLTSLPFLSERCQRALYNWWNIMKCNHCSNDWTAPNKPLQKTAI